MWPAGWEISLSEGLLWTELFCVCVFFSQPEEERPVLNNQLLEMKKRESKLIKDADEEKASLQKSISITSALLTEKDAEPEKLRNEVTVLRRENASFKSLQGLESDKVELELNVKNLELQLKENKRQLSSSSGNTDTQAEEDERAQESQLGSPDREGEMLLLCGI